MRNRTPSRVIFWLCAGLLVPLSGCARTPQVLEVPIERTRYVVPEVPPALLTPIPEVTLPNPVTNEALGEAYRANLQAIRSHNERLDRFRAYLDGLKALAADD